MELANSYLEEGFPFQGRKRKKMEEFLEKSGLTYDPQIIYSVLLCREDGEIIGCGSRHENILKCIAVDEAYQGEGLLQRIVTQLIKQAYTCSIPHLFLFTTVSPGIRSRNLPGTLSPPQKTPGPLS